MSTKKIMHVCNKVERVTFIIQCLEIIWYSCLTNHIYREGKFLTNVSSPNYLKGKYIKCK